MQWNYLEGNGIAKSVTVNTNSLFYHFLIINAFWFSDCYSP